MDMKRVILYNILICCRLALCENTWTSKRRTLIAFTKFLEPCSSHQNLIGTYHGVTWKQTRSALSINYTLVLTEDVPSDQLEVVIDWTRCRGSEALDSCLKFTNIKSSHVCGMLKSDRDVWSPFIKCVNPRLGCPLHKGEYHGKNCSFSTDKLNLIPLDGSSFWKVNVTVSSRGKLFICGTVQGSFKPAIET